MNTQDVKKDLIKQGFYKSEEELSWLTDEYLQKQEANAIELKPFEIDSIEAGVELNSIDYGNHFYTSNNGKRWHWKSGDNVTGGNLACSQKHSWYYDVRTGDTVVRAGKCREGYVYYKFNIFH